MKFIGLFSSGQATRRFLTGTMRLLSLLSLFGVAWSGTAALFLSACSPAGNIAGDRDRIGGRIEARLLSCSVPLLATIEHMIPEGDAPRSPHWSPSLVFELSFAALALMSKARDTKTESAAGNQQVKR